MEFLASVHSPIELEGRQEPQVEGRVPQVVVALTVVARKVQVLAERMTTPAVQNLEAAIVTNLVCWAEVLVLVVRKESLTRPRSGFESVLALWCRRTEY